VALAVACAFGLSLPAGSAFAADLGTTAPSSAPAPSSPGPSSVTVPGGSVQPMTSYRSDVCTDWACGSATFQFNANGEDVENISISVKDTECNDHVAQIQFKVYYTNGSNYTGPPHSAPGDCASTYAVYNNLSYNGNAAISYVTVRIYDGIHGTQYHGGNEGNDVYDPY
jgi:hypothetical protein